MAKKTKIGSKNPKYNKALAEDVQTPVRTVEYNTNISNSSGKNIGKTIKTTAIWYS